MLKFCNYHKHSMYTNVRVPDCAVSLEEYAKRAVELGHTILSSAEHGWQGNQWETIKLARKYGLKPLIGSEAYWVKDRTESDSSNCHIFIGAKNENGRRALNDVLSEANLTGFYRQPRLDIPLLLSLPKDDVIVTTACVAYWRYEDIEELTAQLANHFGKNLFLEVQYHNVELQRELNKRILALREKLKLPIIMGCDSHYIYPEQAQARTDFLSSKGIDYPEEENWFLDYPDGDTAYQRFATQCVLSHKEIQEAIENTLVFDEVSEYDSTVFDSEIKMPSIYPQYTQDEKNAEYKRLVYQSWDNYKKEIPKEKWGLYEAEIAKEVQTVEATNMADYFINNYHIIKQGKKNGGWLTKTGRGSGVSFITNMLLEFTEVDRIAAKIHMYPERFMSTTRILQSGTLPDIDFNCASIEPFAKAQKEVLGEDHAYPMIAYGTMQKSAAWKLYAKSQGIPFEIANAVSGQIKKYEAAQKKVGDEEKDTINIFDYIDKQYWDIYQKSKDYLGLVTSWSIAPCSYLLYQGSIRKEIGLVKVKDNLCCTLDGHAAEEGHFLKNDLLKVSVVDLIYRAYNRIGREPPTVNELLAMCHPKDKAWDIYEKGCTLGINQCEQQGTATRVAKYKPKNISELGAFVAAVRPGFKSMYKTFEERKPFSFGVKAFDSLIQTEEMPNSFLLYQEQEMAALNYAGIDMSDCYTAIKNIAKKRVEKVLSYKAAFISGFSKVMIKREGKTEEEAAELSQKLWQIIEDSSRYSFNASHSYCVALDSLYTAWLKAHHPLEFYEVLLTIAAEKGDKDKMNALKEEAENYFNIKFPPFRFGQDNRSIKADNEKNIVVNSLTSIKGFSPYVGATLFECSKQGNIKSFIDVLAWLDKRKIKAAKVEPLILIDYFQKFGNINELLFLLQVWELFNQGEVKLIKKEKIESPILLKALTAYADSKLKNGEDSKSFRFNSVDDAMRCLYEVERLLKENTIQPPTLREQIQYSLSVLGYVDVATNQEKDRRRLLITDVFPMLDSGGKPWGYRVGTKSLGTGKTARISIKCHIYKQLPIEVGDIIFATEFYKNQSGYWYLVNYKKEE